MTEIEIMKKACLLCDKSGCGYKIGCIVVKDAEIILEAWNESLPGETYCQNGMCYREEHKLGGGKEIEKVCSIHAEASIVAQAAARGIPLAGSSVFVTTFPCLICARLLVKTGIKKLFYMSDYMGSNLGRSLLKAAGIQVKQILEKEVWK